MSKKGRGLAHWLKSILFYSLAFALGVVITFFVIAPEGFFSSEKVADGKTTSATYNMAEVTEAPPLVSPSIPLKPVDEKSPPMLAIVIDDLGQDVGAFTDLLELPVSLAIIPNLRFSSELSRLARQAGREVLLHLPMEPRDLKSHNPGKDALLVSMTELELTRALEKNISSLPYIDGINNHMGSRFTEDLAGMSIILREIKERDLFFLDSVTTGRSVGFKTAKELGLRAAKRNVFIDNTRDLDYILERLNEALKIAEKDGQAIAIGHPYPETIEALKKAIPIFKAKGVRFVMVSELVI